MLPSAEILPDVLPTDRLSSTGRPLPEIRGELRRIPDARNAVSVLGVFLQSFGVIALAVRINHPVAWVLAFLLMGRAQALYAILGHEAVHRLLFSHKRANDVIGKWFLAYPGFVAFDGYRRGPLGPPKGEEGPLEPPKQP